MPPFITITWARSIFSVNMYDLTLTQLVSVQSHTTKRYVSRTNQLMICFFTNVSFNALGKYFFRSSKQYIVVVVSIF
jgi:hypothetical protein